MRYCRLVKNWQTPLTLMVVVEEIFQYGTMSTVRPDASIEGSRGGGVTWGGGEGGGGVAGLRR